MTRSSTVAAVDTALSLGLLGLGSTLFYGGFHLAATSRTAPRTESTNALADAIGMATCGIGIVVVLWWAAASVAAGCWVLLQRSGHTRSAKFAAKCTPVFMRRLAVMVLGLNLMTAHVALAVPNHQTPRASSISASAASPASLHHESAVPQTARANDSVDPEWKPTSPQILPGIVAPAPSRDVETPGHAAEVVVLPGDSLWTITSRILGPGSTDRQIGQQWPLLFQANVKVIGPDPNLLYPGTILHVPARH